MSLTCPLCGGRMATGRTVCTPCEDALLRDLKDIPSLIVHLELAEARVTRLGDGGGTRGEALAWDDRARAAHDRLTKLLAGWVRVLQPQTPDQPKATVIAHTYWLTRHRHLLLRHPAADEALGAIQHAVKQARWAIDRPADKIYAGPCDQCGHDLLAKPGAEEVVCSTCVDDDGRTLVYQVEARRDWMRAETEDLLGNSAWVSAIVTQLGVKVSQSAIRMWVKRGKLTPRTFLPPRTVGGEPRPMYRVGDVIEVARRKLSAAPDRRTP
jgi:hypothetical protein